MSNKHVLFLLSVFLMAMVVLGLASAFDLGFDDLARRGVDDLVVVGLEPDCEEAEWIAARVFVAAHAIIAVSPGVAAYLDGYPQSRGRVQVLANGIDPARFPAELFADRPQPDSPATFTIGFLGSLKPWHGLELLLDVFIAMHSQDPGLRLLLVNDSPKKADIEQSITQAAVDRKSVV